MIHITKILNFKIYKYWKIYIFNIHIKKLKQLKFLSLLYMNYESNTPKTFLYIKILLHII